MQDKIQAILDKHTDDIYYESPEGIDISKVKVVKKELNDLFSLHAVSHQRELLVWLKNKDLVTFAKDEIEEVIDDYKFNQTNCG